MDRCLLTGQIDLVDSNEALETLLVKPFVVARLVLLPPKVNSQQGH